MVDITGNVKQDAVNAEGIEVTAVTDVTSGSETVVASAVTDANGDYTLTGLGSTPVIVTAREDRGIAWPASTAVNLGDRVHKIYAPTPDILSETHPNLKVFYTMDNQDGSTVVDSSGNRDAIIRAGTTFSPGKIGDAMVSTHQNHGLDCGEKTYFDFMTLTHNFAVCFWLKLDAVNTGQATQGVVLLQTGATAQVGYHITVRDDDPYENSIRLMQNYGSSGNAVETFAHSAIQSADTWYHVVCQSDGSNTSIYVDGIDSGATSPVNAVSNPQDNKTYIGTGFIYSLSLQGAIDQFRIFDRSLSPQEIMDLYNESIDPYAHVFDCTTAGTTGVTEPAWNTTGTTNDGTAVWTAKPYFRPISHGPIIPE